MIPTTHLLLTASLLTAQVPCLQPNARPLADHERAALSQLDDPGLAAQSAGRAADALVLDDATRAELSRLQSQDQALAEQRGGELDNDTLMTVLIVLAIVALAVIIF